MTRSRCLSTLCTLLAAFAMAVVPTSTGLADDWHFGSRETDACGFFVGNSGWQNLTTCPSMANNRWHAVHYGVVGNQWDGIDDATTWSLANHYNVLDLVAYVDQDDPLPDVIVYDHDIYGDNNLFAWVDCPANNTGTGGDESSNTRWCRGQILRYNAFYESDWQDTNAARRGLACHELGHTVGLRHHGINNGCVRVSAKTDSNGKRYYHNWIRQHDEEHLDDSY